MLPLRGSVLPAVHSARRVHPQILYAILVLSRGTFTSQEAFERMTPKRFLREIHDTSFQNTIERDIDIRKDVYAHVVLTSGKTKLLLASIASVTRKWCCSPVFSQRNPTEYDDYVRRNVYVNIVLSILLTASDTSVTRRCCPARWLMSSHRQWTHHCWASNASVRGQNYCSCPRHMLPFSGSVVSAKLHVILHVYIRKYFCVLSCVMRQEFCPGVSSMTMKIKVIGSSSRSAPKRLRFAKVSTGSKTVRSSLTVPRRLR